MTTTLTYRDLDSFTGDLQRYRHFINRQILYTPGIQYLANLGGAYWLIDEIALVMGSPVFRKRMSQDPRAEVMLYWSLKLNGDGSATLSASVDAEEAPLFTKHITWTDFPLESVDIWAGFDGQQWTLYLPSEH